MKKRKPETRNSKSETLACRVHPCPHCRTQNFATPARLRQAARIPLTCWKCGEEIQKPLKLRAAKRLRKGGAGGGRKR